LEPKTTLLMSSDAPPNSVFSRLSDALSALESSV
jgi:hypothetical protein